MSPSIDPATTPDFTLLLWGYPLLVSVVSASVAWLGLRALGRRTHPLVWLTTVGLATAVGNASALLCLEVGDLMGAIIVWTLLIAGVSVGGILLGPSRAYVSSSSPDGIGPSELAGGERNG